MGFFRNVVLRNPPGSGQNAADTLGIASLPLDQTPQISASTTAQDSTSNNFGFSNIGADTNTNQVNITNTYTPFGTITKTFGPHTFKVGASLRKNQFNSYNPATSPEGLLQFDGSITNHGAAGNPNTQIADLLLGKIKTAQYEQPQPPTGRRNYNLGIFFQDDWKVTPKLTLNLGVRYEYESPLTIATNIYSRIDPATGTSCWRLVSTASLVRSISHTRRPTFRRALAWLTASTTRQWSARHSALSTAPSSRISAVNSPIRDLTTPSLQQPGNGGRSALLSFAGLPACASSRSEESLRGFGQVLPPLTRTPSPSRSTTKATCRWCSSGISASSVSCLSRLRWRSTTSETTRSTSPTTLNENRFPSRRCLR